MQEKLGKIGKTLKKGQALSPNDGIVFLSDDNGEPLLPSKTTPDEPPRKTTPKKALLTKRKDSPLSLKNKGSKYTLKKDLELLVEQKNLGIDDLKKG